MNITKKTAFGVTAATAALVVAGIAGPAMASDDTSDSPTRSYSFNANTETPVVIAPDVKLLNGDNFNELLNALNGGIGNGHAVASGIDITAPTASGNDTAIGNVSEVANGNNVSDTSDVSDVSDSSNVSDKSNVSDSGSDVTSNASDLVGDIADSVNLDGMLGGILGR